jgi:hypothetical protein
VKLKPPTSHGSFLKVVGDQLVEVEADSADLSESGGDLHFDAVLDGRSDQQDLFDEHVKPLLSGLLQGRNACIICFGPSG